MAINLGRVFSSTTLLSTPSRAEPLTRATINSVSRLLCSSATQSQSQHQNPSKEQREPTDEKLESTENQADDDEEEDDGYMNKETGEIGGPKGPEPTRFGDWERNGRCSDFWVSLGVPDLME